MTNKQPSDWLTLNDVAVLLGVHASTVRLWSDKGLLPTHRTSGGHRRYQKHEVELWLQASREKHTLEPNSALQSAVGKIRMQVGDGHLEAEPWYQKLDSEARTQYRLSGMALVRGLMNYLASDGSEESSEAFALGYEYASRARRYGLSSAEATRAFLFFRNNLLEALIQAYNDARVSPSLAWGQVLGKLHRFTDRVLLSLLETYQAFEEKNR